MILAQEYSDKNVTAWGGMQEMKMLIEKSGISKKIEKLGLPEKKGYNPTKRGRNSHHPLFAFVNDIRMVANCWNRSGNTSSSNNCINFLEETFAILKNKTVGLFRADGGFCSEQILKFIEDKNIAY